jgi:S1-C subfamily serine protease
MEDNRNKEYDVFFRYPNDQHKQDDSHKQHEPQKQGDGSIMRESSSAGAESKDSYYYAYGPYRSQANWRSPSEAQPPSVVGGSAEGSIVSPQYGETPQWSQATNAEQADRYSVARERVWQVRPARRGGWLTSFLAAFLCCALIMTGLVYASDVNNWFTGGKVSAAEADRTPPGVSGEITQGSTVSYTGNESDGTVVLPAPSLPGSIADIVEQSSPAVVLIETYVKSSRRSNNRYYNMDFFEYFFGDRIQIQPDDGGNMINSGLGTGFIFDKDGYILTNEHVISGADEIYVTVEGFTEPFKAQLLGSDFDLDLAVLKISGSKPFATLPIGDSTKLRVGEWVTAIGNPLGYDHTVSVGVLSAKGRKIQIPEGNRTRYYENLLQTDASINSGNSGGPLLNMNGEVIGINTAVSTAAQGIGFAIPSSTFVSVIDHLKNNQSIPKPYIGVGISNIEEAWLEDLQLKSTEGALVTQVESGSPAAAAGIKTWDVIIKVNDKKIRNTEELINYVRELGVGARATVTVIRDGKEIEIGVIIGDRNASR